MGVLKGRQKWGGGVPSLQSLSAGSAAWWMLNVDWGGGGVGGEGVVNERKGELGSPLFVCWDQGGQLDTERLRKINRPGPVGS